MMNSVSASRLPANGTMTEFTDKFIAELEPIFTGQQVDTSRLIRDMTPRLQAILDKKPATLTDLARPS